MPITVRPMPEQVSPQIVDKLLQCDTGTIGHFEHETFMDSSIRAVMPEAKIAGTAVTLRLPHVDTALTSYCLSFVRPGDVVVIDRCGDDKHACWGGIVSLAARMAGIAGVVVNGPTTDWSEQREMGVPCWCTGPSPITGKRQGQNGSMNIPIACGGVAVNPGDAVLADESGVFVCAPARAEAIAEEAIRRLGNEPKMAERLRAGEKFGVITGTVDLINKKLEEQGDTPLKL